MPRRHVRDHVIVLNNCYFQTVLKNLYCRNRNRCSVTNEEFCICCIAWKIHFERFITWSYYHRFVWPCTLPCVLPCGSWNSSTQNMETQAETQIKETVFLHHIISTFVYVLDSHLVEQMSSLCVGWHWTTRAVIQGPNICSAHITVTRWPILVSGKWRLLEGCLGM